MTFQTRGVFSNLSREIPPSVINKMEDEAIKSKTCETLDQADWLLVLSFFLDKLLTEGHGFNFRGAD